VPLPAITFIDRPLDPCVFTPLSRDSGVDTGASPSPGTLSFGWMYCQWEYTSQMAEPRSDRLQLRVTPQQREIIESAAASQQETITDYVVRHAVSAAKEDLADRRYFVIDDSAWMEFEALLERPPVYKPRLEKLLSQPAPWQD
jgi:uncharacterized protein (DUF1778 family)